MAPIAAGLSGVAWLLWHSGLEILDPREVAFAQQGDWAQSATGTLFFLSAPWTFPLGKLPHLLEPLGTTVGFTDSIPWVACLAKLLVSNAGDGIQLLGPWLALCFFAQGFLGARIVRRVSRDELHQWLGGALFAVTPPLIWRTMHPALCGHWILLALFLAHLTPAENAGRARRLLATGLGIVLVAAGVHPYLAAMAVALAMALAGRMALERWISAWEGIAWAFAAVAVAAAVFGLFGYLQSSQAATGFGFYSAHPSSLVNPIGRGRFLPSFRIGGGQYEGFAYLGAGGIALGAVGGALFAARRTAVPWRRIAVVVAAALALAGYASIHPRMHVDGLFTSEVSPLAPLARAFRANGRFIWPLHYLVLIGAVFSFLACAPQRRWLTSSFLAACIALQIGDLRAEEVIGNFRRGPGMPTSGPEWSRAAGRWRHVAAYPQYLADGSARGCNDAGYTDEDLWPVAWAAWRMGAAFNSGYVARLDVAAAKAACARLEEQLTRGEPSADTLYVIHPSRRAQILARGQMVCTEWDGYEVCAARRGRASPFEALASP